MKGKCFRPQVHCAMQLVTLRHCQQLECTESNISVTWCLKAGIVEPEETFIVKQRLGELVSVVTDTQSTIEELLETLFSMRSEQRGYKDEFSWESAVEFQSSKSAVTRELSSARGGWEDGVQLTVGMRREHFTYAVAQWYFECVIHWTVIVPVLKSVARKRRVETVQKKILKIFS
jgi:hypothetical protein